MWIRCKGDCQQLFSFFFVVFVFFQFFPLKLVYFWTKSKKYIYGCSFHSFYATDLKFRTKNNGGMKYSTLKTVIFASYWGSPLVQFSKFKNFLWVCWFLCKNLSNFVSLPWKFHNPYCHNKQWSSQKKEKKYKIFITFFLAFFHYYVQIC